MDILTHICSGVAVATVIASFAKEKDIKPLKILGFGALGGAFPDIDAISMWSHFDSTIGHFLGLSHTGRTIYGAKFWYSHHAFFHSVAAALIIALLLVLMGYLLRKVRKGNKKETLFEYCKRKWWLLGAFIAGYLCHLLGDLPTPSSVWGGVNMFYPSDAYVGGSGKIWWWNNYDIFLLLVACIIANTVVILTCKRHLRQLTVGIALLTFTLIAVQTNTRHYDYAYIGNASNYAEMEQQSKTEQERILGGRIYKCMKWVDDHIPLNF